MVVMVPRVRHPAPPGPRDGGGSALRAGPPFVAPCLETRHDLGVLPRHVARLAGVRREMVDLGAREAFAPQPPPTRLPVADADGLLPAVAGEDAHQQDHHDQLGRADAVAFVQR